MTRRHHAVDQPFEKDQEAGEVSEHLRLRIVRPGSLFSSKTVATVKTSISLILTRDTVSPHLAAQAAPRTGLLGVYVLRREMRASQLFPENRCPPAQPKEQSMRAIPSPFPALQSRRGGRTQTRRPRGGSPRRFSLSAPRSTSISCVEHSVAPMLLGIDQNGDSRMAGVFSTEWIKGVEAGLACLLSPSVDRANSFLGCALCYAPNSSGVIGATGLSRDPTALHSKVEKLSAPFRPYPRYPFFEV